MKRPNVFEYLDFRVYLKDLFSFFKSESRGFSFRRFSKDAGFSSPNFLKLVYDGKRNLSSQSIHKIAAAFKLSRSETSFLEDLALFNQAVTQAKKNFYYERMLRSRTYREIRALDQDQFEYYSSWYHIPIRELVETADFKEDCEWIAKRLQPAISPKQAEESIALLLKLKLLKRNASGKLIQSDVNLTTGPEVRSLAVMNYHKEMIKQAADSLDSVKSKDRDVSSVTVTLSLEQMKELKDRIFHFRKSLLSWISASNHNRDQVYQLNIQIFPMTKTGEAKP